MMSRFVRIASVLFDGPSDRTSDTAGDDVLQWLGGASRACRPGSLDLVVFSEGVGAVGQKLDTALGA